MSDVLETEKVMSSPQRPRGLTILCILTGLSTVFSLFSEFTSLINGPLNETQLRATKIEFTKLIDELKTLEMDSLAVMIEKLNAMTVSLNNQFYAVTLTTICILLVGLSGAVMMWLRNKVGFHLYICYSLLVAVQLYFFVAPSAVPTPILVWNVLISGLFVFLYSRHLSWLK
jgi:hypothetical protein